MDRFWKFGRSDDFNRVEALLTQACLLPGPSQLQEYLCSRTGIIWFVSTGSNILNSSEFGKYSAENTHTNFGRNILFILFFIVFFNLAIEGEIKVQIKLELGGPLVADPHAW